MVRVKYQAPPYRAEGLVVWASSTPNAPAYRPSNGMTQ